MGLSEEQHALRLSGVGASEVGAVVGAEGAWESALTVWARKTGQLEKVDFVPEYIELGNLMEPVVASLYTRRTGHELVESGTLVHPTDPLRIATPDRLMKNLPGIVQIKKVRSRSEKWGEEGSADVPENIVAQVQWELSVTGRDFGDVPVLFYGSKLVVYRIYRDDELIGLLADLVARWWRDYVVTKEMPPPDGSDSSRDTISRLYPKSNGKWTPLVPGSEDHIRIAELARIYVQARDDEKAAKTKKEEAGNLLRVAIGENEGFTWPSGIFGKYNVVAFSNRAGTPLWKSIAEHFQPSPKLIKEHTGAPSRSIRVDLK